MPRAIEDMTRVAATILAYIAALHRFLRSGFEEYWASADAAQAASLRPICLLGRRRRLQMMQQHDCRAADGEVEAVARLARAFAHDDMTKKARQAFISGEADLGGRAFSSLAYMLFRAA